MDHKPMLEVPVQQQRLKPMKDLLTQLKNELQFIQTLVKQLEDEIEAPPFIPDRDKKPPTLFEHEPDVYTQTYVDGGI